MILTIDRFLKLCYNNDVRLSGITSQSIAEIGALVVQRSFFVLFLAVRVRVTGTTQDGQGVYKKTLFFCVLTLDVFVIVCYYNSTEIGKVERLSHKITRVILHEVPPFLLKS